MGLRDPRGYNLPSVGLSCRGDPGAPLKYTLWLTDNAWFKGAEATENTPIEVPDHVRIDIDGRDAITVYGKAEFANIFQGEISWDELMRIREARAVIYETSQGFPGIAFSAIGTARAVDTLLTACGITPTKENLSAPPPAPSAPKPRSSLFGPPSPRPRMSVGLDQLR